MARRIIIASIVVATLLGMPLAICGAEQEYHVIQMGETLYSIAKSYSIPYEILANINGITDPSKIHPGIVLLIPQTHTVAKGETYYGIAKKYDISIQELKAANGLSESYVLQVGDVLMIPEKGSTSTAIAQSVPPAAPQPIANAPATAPASASTAAPAAATTPKASSSAPQATSSQINSSQITSPEKPQAQPSTPAPASPPAQPAVTANAPASQTPGSALSADKADGQDKNAQQATDALITWPVNGKGQYMSGKLEGIMFQTNKGALVKAVASGTVVSAGPSRGFGQVVFVQSKSGFVYVYGGNSSILVKTGDSIAPGKTIATVGLDTKDGSPTAYFFVFRNGQPVDPSLAPRE